MINKRRVGKLEEKVTIRKEKDRGGDDLGFILWKLESIEDFLPCYKTMMKQG